MFQTTHRTHNCGELRPEHIGHTVTLTGWVQGIRNLNHFIFIDLRDRYGITQINVPASAADMFELAKSLGREFVLKATGTVVERESKTDKIATGSIEIRPDSLELMNRSEIPPFKIEDNTDGLEDVRMKYRYLDLRRPEVAKRIMLRTRVVKAVREYLDAQQFLEIETPVLIKSTPEGARDFLVPSRLHHGTFYALPQSPQILKQLLMVAGMDRYYQIVKCFRDEDFRGDRQPEFTQVDCEMAFVTQEDILRTFEGMTKHVFRSVMGVELPDFRRLPYEEALSKYGSDKPDLRFGCEIVELNAVAGGTDFAVFENVIKAGGIVAGVNAKGCAAYTRKQIDQLTDFVKAPHRGAGGLVWIRVSDEGIKSSLDGLMEKGTLPQGFTQKIAEAMGAEKGDLLLIMSDMRRKTQKILGDLRLELANREGWRKEGDWSVFWVVDFPLFELDEETGGRTFAHHPFVMPHPDQLHLLDTEPEKVHAYCYDLVMNGNEIVSGSVRIHRPDIQEKIFTLLGMTEEEQQQKFGFLLEAFKYGAPPHAGCAFGLDRWVMLMGGGETIRDVIAFPKTAGGRDAMMDAPASVPPKALNELGIQVKE